MNTWWNVDKLDVTCDYIVFDDINFDTFVNWQVFFGVSIGYFHLLSFIDFTQGAQQEFEVTDKYRGKKTIKDWGKPAIWLSNKDPRMDQPQWKIDWLNANAVVVYLHHALYTIGANLQILLVLSNTSLQNQREWRHLSSSHRIHQSQQNRLRLPPQSSSSTLRHLEWRHRLSLGSISLR